MIYFKDIYKCESFLSSSSQVDGETVLKIITDSRLVEERSTFLAISGERFNALDFLDTVISKKASFVIYDEGDENEEKIEKHLGSCVFIKTKKSVTFLQEITRILSDRFQAAGGRLIAIGGSNGKTTTKEMLFHLLSSVEKETICTQQNNNNHIGVPLTLLQINDKTKYAIIELGSNHPGEIETLCNIVNPKYGVVTNIGDTHLEFFHSRSNVFKEEGFLYQAVENCGKKGNLFFKNTQDKFLKKLKETDFTCSFGEEDSNFSFLIHRSHVIIQNEHTEYRLTNRYITGWHNFFNLSVAFTIAKSLSCENAKEFVSSCADFKPSSNRSEWINHNRSKVFLDAYNANPSSMRMAIDGFVEKVEKDFCLILGDMNELGLDASRYHEDLGLELYEKGIQNIFYVGIYRDSFAAKCKSAQTFPGVEELKTIFQTEISDKFKYIFIKGSRSLQLESILDITLD